MNFPCRDPSEYSNTLTAVVMPGKVGLAATHAFAHGVPVITREHGLHAPEVEYIESGRNGLIIAGNVEVFPVKRLFRCKLHGAG